MPTDRGGIEKRLRAQQRGDARRVRVPLVPADEDADVAVAGREAAKAEVARREVERLVIERIVGYMHFAINAGEVVGLRTAAIKYGGGIVIKTRRATLEEAGDQRDLV